MKVALDSCCGIKGDCNKANFIPLEIPASLIYGRPSWAYSFAVCGLQEWLLSLASILSATVSNSKIDCNTWFSVLLAFFISSLTRPTCAAAKSFCRGWNKPKTWPLLDLSCCECFVHQSSCLYFIFNVTAYFSSWFSSLSLYARSTLKMLCPWCRSFPASWIAESSSIIVALLNFLIIVDLFELCRCCVIIDVTLILII